MSNERTSLVYVVTCYNSIVGVYENADDAAQIVKERVAKGNLSSMHAFPITKCLTSKS